ncbi:MAG: hypothetical protein ACFCVC_14240, partial [Acidimicrobiia bacterium]
LTDRAAGSVCHLLHLAMQLIVDGDGRPHGGIISSCCDVLMRNGPPDRSLSSTQPIREVRQNLGPTPPMRDTIEAASTFNLEDRRAPGSSPSALA